MLKSDFGPVSLQSNVGSPSASLEDRIAYGMYLESDDEAHWRDPDDMGKERSLTFEEWHSAGRPE